MKTVARLENVSQHFGATVALKDITLSIPARRMVGLIGPDGVGKSSLLSLISGARVIEHGNIMVLGGDMSEVRHRQDVCPKIAWMPQGLGKNLYHTLSVYENVDFFARLFSHDKAERDIRINELLQSTGLAPFRDRPAGKLSGGMKQKLGLCCALIHDPQLLILDEPTTGVDPLSRAQFWDLIDSIRQRQPEMSVLVATAYMEEAERFDWLVAMNAGEVLATGSADELKAHTASQTLEQAFIALLPEAQRLAHKEVIIPPRNADESEIAIEARGLTMRFGQFVAVDHVNFRIARGEIFGFLGSNGCGKSTTMEMLTGLLPASEGEAWLFGQPVEQFKAGFTLFQGDAAKGLAGVDLVNHLDAVGFADGGRKLLQLQTFPLAGLIDHRAVHQIAGLVAPHHAQGDILRVIAGNEVVDVAGHDAVAADGNGAGLAGLDGARRGR